MTTIQNRPDGPPRRRVLGSRSRPRLPGLALLALAAVGLVQAGCKSDGCSTCGIGSSIATGFRAVGSGVKAVGSFVFHHKKGCGGGPDCGCDGGGVIQEGGVVVDQGIPVVPGGMVVPPSVPMIPPPAGESDIQLKAIPDSQPANPTSGSGTTPPSTSTSTSKPTTSRSTPAGTSRPGYTTSVPRNGSVARRGSEADPSIFSASNPSSRPADSSSSSDLLDNIPPVDLPSEVTRKASSSPVKPATTPPAAEKVSAADGGALTLPPINAPTTTQAPGLRRFAPIAPAIAGGSAPSIEGLDWLKEKGYRTLLDLRKSSEVEPEFADAVNDRGMVYISLPLMASRLDASRLARFDDLISRTENRPLFFCDADGTRAALAWYIHERVVGQEDAHSALGKAEELGLGAAEAKLAEDYLATQKPKAKAAMARVTMATSPLAEEARPEPTPEPVVTPPALPETPDPRSKSTLAPVAPAAPPRFDEVTPPMLPGEDRPQASKAPLYYDRDPAAWRPVAALVLTSIGVPLAFWSRTMLSESRSVRRRASLPGAAPRSLDAPIGSDA